MTAGPVVYSIILNGASQPGGQTGTALLPLFDMLNHNVKQEVSQSAFDLWALNPDSHVFSSLACLGQVVLCAMIGNCMHEPPATHGNQYSMVHVVPINIEL